MSARYHIEELLDLHDEECRLHQDSVGDSCACVCDLPERLLEAFDAAPGYLSHAQALVSALNECGVVRAGEEVAS